MKPNLLFLQLPVIIACTFLYGVSELGTRGELDNTFLREHVWPATRRIASVFTDFKFRIRGARPPQSKVVIVDIDNTSIEAIGRWPWHRDVIGYLVHQTFDAGARAVGFDMVFSERDTRVPDELRHYLAARKLNVPLEDFETDFVLRREIALHPDRIVLGWTPESPCQPAYDTADDCPVTKPDWLAAFPRDFGKFSVSQLIAPSGFDPKATAMTSFPRVLPNEEMFSSVARHAGYFSVEPDPDGYIRRDVLLAVAEGKIFPSLPLELARVGLGDDIRVKLDNRDRVDSLELVKSGIRIPVSPLGVADINFRGPSGAFPSISALEMMTDKDQLDPVPGRRVASVSKKALLQNAFVLIGVTALGAYDMRSFPFDPNTPGVEGNATILDNILSGSFLVRDSGHSAIWLLLLMTLGVIAFGFGIDKLESVPGLALFGGVVALLGFVDVKFLFERNIQVETSFLYVELGAVFILTLAAKYVVEERNKKFIRSAFTKYVSPDVVDAILDDPAKLSLGGEKRNLTILFSDIRGFTTFSEQMEPKALTTFLNDYLDIMTGVIFAHGGTLDKYIGDAVMAFWGAPLAQKDHSLNACKAAVAMIRALAENRDRLLKQYGVPVQIGIGINTGVVNVGNMGSSRNFEYTAIGDHVNLASRTEGLTKEYGVEIVTTRFTLDEIASHGLELPPHRVLDQVKVKGKKNAVELIQLLVHDLPRSSLEAFDEGRRLYRLRQWDRAIAQFGISGDGPSQVFIERCRDFKIAPPPSDWDGSWEMHSK